METLVQTIVREIGLNPSIYQRYARVVRHGKKGFILGYQSLFLVDIEDFSRCHE